MTRLRKPITKFLELRPGVLDAYIQEQRGDAYMAAGNPGAAVTAYDASIKAPQEGTTIWTELKLGKAYTAMGDFTNAIKKYLEIYEKSDNDYARAQANLLMGQAYLTMGKPNRPMPASSTQSPVSQVLRYLFRAGAAGQRWRGGQ